MGKFLGIGITMVQCSLSGCTQPIKTNTTTVNPISNKINGISFVASPKTIVEKDVMQVQQVHANWVALMPFAFMQSIDSPRIYYNSQRQWKGESIDGIKETATSFKTKDMKVMLKPQLWIGNGMFTGHIKMTTEVNWRVLEQQYEMYILDFAKAAEAVHCDMFCIGTELNSFVSQRPMFWDSLIIKVKKYFTGKITYAENWDSYDKVLFWKQLDYIGIDAYFPISEQQLLTASVLKNGWEKHKQAIKAIHAKTGLPVLFTEYGYRSTDYNAKEPWKEIKAPVNVDNQTKALEALYKQFWTEPWFAGGFLWKWYDNSNVGEANINDYTPQYKPAEDLIRKVYSGSRE